MTFWNLFTFLITPKLSLKRIIKTTICVRVAYWHTDLENILHLEGNKSTFSDLLNILNHSYCRRENNPWNWFYYNWSINALIIWNQWEIYAWQNVHCVSFTFISLFQNHVFLSSPQLDKDYGVRNTMEILIQATAWNTYK